MTTHRTISAALFSALLLLTPLSQAQNDLPDTPIGADRDLDSELPDTVPPAPETAEPAKPQSETETTEPAEPQKLKAKTEKAQTKAEPESTQASSEASSKTRGLLGPVLIGPTFSTFAVPTFARVGIETKITQWAGLAFEYGVLPQVPLSGVSVAANSSLVTARLYPFRGSFFLGVGVGSQMIKARKTEKIQGVEVTGSMEITTPFYTPQLGWRWIWKSGFMMGMEFGYQLSQGSSVVAVSSDAPAQVTAHPDYIRLENEIRDAGDKIGNVSLPHVALLQIGYFF